jgi:hypothetical protein
MRTSATLFSVPLIALLALPLAADIAAPEQNEKCSIAGLVVAAGSGIRLADAKITIHRDEAEASSPPIVVKSDPAGQYVITDLEPGRYSVYAERSGYLSQMYGERKRNREGTAVILEPGKKLQGIDFRLIATGTIAGRVLGRDNEPIVGATVQAFAPRYVQGELRLIVGGGPVSTNDLAEYRIYGLAPGHYYVGVSGQEPHQTVIAQPKGAPREERYVSTLYPSVINLDQATGIEVQPGGEIRGIDIVPLVAPTFHIRGHIVGFGPTDQYNRVQLRAVRSGWEVGGRSAESPLDQLSNFEFSGITPGSYIVSVFGSRRGSYSYAWLLVRIVDADVDDVALVPSTEMELRGHVRVEGGERIDVRKLMLTLSNSDSRTQPSVLQLESDGSFLFRTVGHYVYRIGIFRLPEDFYIKSVRLGDEETSRTSIDLSNAEAPAGMLEIVASGTGGRIDGVVKNEKDEPKGGAVVVLVPDSSHRRESDLFKNTTTDENGRFVIRGIRPGDYKLFAWDDIEPGTWWDPDFLSHYERRGEEIKIATNERASCDLHLIWVKPY